MIIAIKECPFNGSVERKIVRTRGKQNPTSYDISCLKKWWFQDNRKQASIIKIFEEFNTTGMIDSCIGASDLLGIKEKGSDFFYSNFGFNKLWGLGDIFLIEDELFAPRMGISVDYSPCNKRFKRGNKIEMSLHKLCVYVCRDCESVYHF